MFKCDHFKIQELVSPEVYNFYTEAYGIKKGEDLMWSFFDEDCLRDLDFIREEWGSSIIINNWCWNGGYKQSGLRCNIDPLVANKSRPYLSGHVLGKGFDLKPKNKKFKEFYDFIIGCQFKFKGIKRVESFDKTPTWIHVDGLRTGRRGIKIFN